MQSDHFLLRAMTRAGLVALVIALAACAGGQPSGPSPSPSVVAVSIGGPSTLYMIGDTATLTATETLIDGSTREAGSLVRWQSSDPGVVTVSPAGVITAIAAGAADVSVTDGRVSAQTTVHVIPIQWRRVPGPPGDEGFLRIAGNPRDDAVLYAGTSKALYTTFDRGESWTRVADGQVSALKVAPADPSRIYAITGLHDVLRSSDGGHTFSRIQRFDDPLVSLLASAAPSHALYVAFGGLGNPNPSGVFASMDDGTTWVRRPFAIAGPLIPLDIAEDSVTDVLYVGNEIADHPQPYRPPFVRSPDEGQTWIDATGVLPWHVIRIAVDSGDHSVLALTEGSGLYKSTDGARSWVKLTARFGLSLVQDPTEPQRVFIGDLARTGRDGGVYISEEGGSQFVRFGLVGTTVRDLWLSSHRTQLYAASSGSGLYVADISSLIALR